MRDEARQATICAYAARFAGMPDYKAKYEGDFDYQAVANSVDLPNGSEKSKHHAKWATLYQAFDRAWNEFQNTQYPRRRAR
jgi:hypothetical protein